MWKLSKGAVTSRKVRLLYFQKLAGTYLSFLCFHETRIWIWNFTIFRPLYNYLQVLFASIVIDSFFVEKIWLLQKFTRRLYFQKMAGTYLSFLHILRTWSTCWTLIFILSSQESYKYLIILKKKILYLLLIFELDHWPNFVVYIAIKPSAR